MRLNYTPVVQGRKGTDSKSPDGFAAVPHACTSLPGMSDAAFRAWVAIDRWAFRNSFPSNADLARACGWLSASNGVPAAWKAVKAIRELESLGLVQRLTDRSNGHFRRVGLTVVRPSESGGMPSTEPVLRQNRGGTAQAHGPLIKEEQDVPIDRTSNPERGEDRPTEPVEIEAVVATVTQPEKAAPKVSESAVETEGKAIHARLYEGRSPAIAAGDWRQWERAYLGVGRDLLAGRLTADQVDLAVTTGRREDSRKRGARFLATIRAFRAGRAVGGASRPDPVAAVVHRSEPVRLAVKPGPDDPPLIPRLPDEPIGAYCLRLASSLG